MSLSGSAVPNASFTRNPLASVVLLCLPLLTWAQHYDPSLYAGMKWRQVGPFRAGRASAVSGISGNPAVYYMGTPGGGVWKTVDGGVVWSPIFDEMRVASIGAIAVAPSNPAIVYVGTGDVSDVGGAINEGNGVYKSTDSGKTWTHIGLEATQQIGGMWIDPKNADVVLVAALGHTFAPDGERGIFKTADGGKTWRKVLYKDDTTGAIDLSFAPDNSKIGFAALWTHYVKPGNPQALLNTSSGGFIYKTLDGGDTWTPVNAPGLPTNKLGRIGVATGPGGKLVFAIIAAQGESSGLYRSDDGGTNWQRSTTDSRIRGSGYFSRVFIDPQNPDVVYIAQTSLYRSSDGGRTFLAYKGAPGGDDNHALWIDPANSERMIMASDQGATISMDTGKSWSSWYNQPTGQIYHLSADNRYPYWIYGTQQDSGSIATLSRGDYGQITFLDWDPIGGYEFGYILPDPLNPNVVFAGGPGRGLVRIDRMNRQVATISPNVSRDGDYRVAMNPPLAFSPQDPHVLYEGTQFLLETRDRGVTWKAISPDLTQRPGSEQRNEQAQAEDENESPAKKLKTKEAEETVKPPNRTAINTFSPSPVAAGEIWAGTTNGLLQLTPDSGKTWKDVTPPGLSVYALISAVEASHFDPAVAYVAVDRHEENDFRPHIYKTRDSGKTWQETVAGIGARDLARVVREDPARKGLLYAGTENAAYVSFDDGDHWSSLLLNMPVTSVRDLAVRGNDLVAATYGRAFWVLDDVTPLRQIDSKLANAQTFLYKPDKALRVRLDLNEDTPLPPEMPAGQNPPNGASIDYILKSTPSNDIQLAIYDENGQLVRQFSSAPEPASTEPPPNVPDYWLARPEPLSKQAGMNRFLWDLRYASPLAIRHEYPISALYQDTPGEPLGALAVPGKYEVRLTVDGKTFKQPLDVVMDPRVDVSTTALVQELSLDKKLTDLVTASYKFFHQASEFRKVLASAQAELARQNEAGATLEAVKDLDQSALKIQGSENAGGGPGAGKPKPTFALLNRELGSLAATVDGADAAPTPAMQQAFEDYCRDLTTVTAKWNQLMTDDVPNLNAQLVKFHLALPASSIAASPACK